MGKEGYKKSVEVQNVAFCILLVEFNSLDLLWSYSNIECHSSISSISSISHTKGHSRRLRLPWAPQLFYFLIYCNIPIVRAHNQTTKTQDKMATLLLGPPITTLSKLDHFLPSFKESGTILSWYFLDIASSLWARSLLKGSPGKARSLSSAKVRRSK